MAKKVILYLFGVLLGLFLVKFLFGGRNIACTYFPEQRVLDNISKKNLILTEFSKCQINALNLGNVNLDSLISVSKVKFSESKVRGEACPEYLLISNGLDKSYYIVVRNCSDVATVLYLDTAKYSTVRCP